MVRRFGLGAGKGTSICNSTFPARLTIASPFCGIANWQNNPCFPTGLSASVLTLNVSSCVSLLNVIGSIVTLAACRSILPWRRLRRVSYG